jgi:hypothetical protein
MLYVLCQRLIESSLAAWTYNAQPFLVTYGVSSALSRRFGDYSLMWFLWTAYLGSP